MLRAFTVAPVMTACFSSLTSPEIEPVFCAKAGQRHAGNTAESISSLVAVCIGVLRSDGLWNRDGPQRTQMKFVEEFKIVKNP